MYSQYDLLVVGGGINGAAVARDASGRGLSTLLVEQDDLASHTSSASTKLIHGGLRYLEQYEFRMVRKALNERDRLMRAAPHLIRPLQFVLPHDRRMRPQWLMKLGLLIYDALGGEGRLPAAHAVRLDKGIYAAQIKPDYPRGFVYSDCWGDDSRLVVANAQGAAEKGAMVLTRTRCVRARRSADGWLVDIEHQGRRQPLRASVIVNATGSWTADFLRHQVGMVPSGSMRLIKGSHIVTRRLYPGDHAYILQNPDKRIVFVIPYEDDFSLIGTTDVDWEGALTEVAIDTEEIEYLCSSANRWLRPQIKPDDVIWSYAGIRPLYDDASARASEISRDYVLSLDEGPARPPILSIYGGKITTHRALAEEAVNRLAHLFPAIRPAWTGESPLPGGDLDSRKLPGLIDDLTQAAPFLDRRTARRMAQSYGSKVYEVLQGASQAGDLGEEFGAGLTSVEVDYLVRHEWAQTAEDILWRRSKLGLHMSRSEIAHFTAAFQAKWEAPLTNQARLLEQQGPKAGEENPCRNERHS